MHYLSTFWTCVGPGASLKNSVRRLEAKNTTLFVWRILLFLVCFSSLRAQPQQLSSNKLVEVREDGYFYLKEKKTVVLGVESYLRDPTYFQKSIPLIQALGANFVFTYGYTKNYALLEDVGLWAAPMVAIAKQCKHDFGLTGGGLCTVPDDLFVQKQLEQIRKVVPPLAKHKNILFWLIGGEFVNGDYYKDKGNRLREIVKLFADEIRKIDPYHRPITVAHHLLEVLIHEKQFIDFSDIVDFSWFTIATHLHKGDLSRVPEKEKWAPTLALMEKPSILRSLLKKAYRLNHKKPLYLASWYPNAVYPICLPSREKTLEKWNIIAHTVPISGAAFWAFYHWIKGSPHTLVRKSGKALAVTESYLGVKGAYTQFRQDSDKN